MPRAKKQGADAFSSNASVVKLSAGDAKKSARKGQLSSVIYLGHVPHGFYEKQMQGFFSQFGTVSKLRLARSKKTTRSKGYAYIKFEDPKVAIVVANTMDQYLLFGHKLTCSVLKEEDVHKDLFKGAGKQFKKVPWRDIARERQNAPRDEEQVAKIRTRLVKQDAKKRKKLAELGIEYDFEGYGASPEPLAVTEGAEGDDSSDAEEDKNEEVEQPKSRRQAKRKSPLAKARKGKSAATNSNDNTEKGDEEQQEEPESETPAKRTRKTPAKKAKPPSARATRASTRKKKQ